MIGGHDAWFVAHTNVRCLYVWIWLSLAKKDMSNVRVNVHRYSVDRNRYLGLTIRYSELRALGTACMYSVHVLSTLRPREISENKTNRTTYHP